MKKLSIILTAIISSMLLWVGTPMIALADCTSPATTQEAIQCGANGASGQSSPDTTKPASSFNEILTSGLNLLSAAAGIAAVVMIVIGGFKFITSSGKEDKIKSARTSIMYAVIGLVIVALAQIIVQFVLNKATQDNSTTSTTGTSGYSQNSNANLH